ncbi:MAG: ABC transporter ATP-binding protein [Gammaproteobacteria bacterium]|nr:ABC transporter ATP-binding protein [Gammaproteobacteria bacterium]
MAEAIQISNLSKTYDNGLTALRGVSLVVEEGDFFALLGPNGAGKSTTIGILSTLVRKSDGDVRIFGKNVESHVYETKLDLGVVPQEVNFSQFEKVGDIVLTQAGYYGLTRRVAASRVEKYLKKLGLWEKRNERSRSLSGGMKRRLMIARALVHEPRLLILDEPTAGVDIELRRSMWEFLSELNQSGTTIILTTHYLEEAEQLCRNIAIIDGGRIVEHCSMKKLLAQLDSHTYVIELSDPMTGDIEFGSLVSSSIVLDSQTLEITISANVGMSSLFDLFKKLDLKVQDLRMKSNRLEQLFLTKLEKLEESQLVQ